jgi:hypothetical protein
MIFSNWSWRQEGRKKERIMITMNLNHYIVRLLKLMGGNKQAKTQTARIL